MGKVLDTKGKKRILCTSIIFLCLVLALSQGGFAADLELPESEINTCIYYFYGEDCEDCHLTNAHLSELQSNYPGIDIYEFEVYYDEQNIIHLNDLYLAYGVDETEQAVPALFLENSYFIGASSIELFLESQLENNELCPSLDPIAAIGIFGEGQPKNVLDILDFGSITGTGVGNSISNSNMAVLLLFLILLIGLIEDKRTHKTKIEEKDNAKKENIERMDLEEKKELVLRNSIVYLITLYGMLLITGLGIIGVTKIGLQSVFFTRLIAVICTIISLIIIKQFLFEKKIIPPEYQAKLQPAWRKFRHYCTTTPGFIVLGIIASLFVAASWEGQYQLLHKLLLDSGSRGQVFSLFLWHNILLLIPFAFIFGVSYWRLRKIEEMKYIKAQEHHIKLLIFTLAVVMVIISFMVLFYL